MATMACSAQLHLSPRTRIAPSSPLTHRNPAKSLRFARPRQHGCTCKTPRTSLVCGSSNDRKDHDKKSRYSLTIEAQGENPPIMPNIMTPGGALGLSSVLFRNRTIFIGQPVNSQVAQRVISQLITLVAVDENADIMIYINCPGGNIYSILAVYDCMSWVKPKVGTICFGYAASQAALLLAGGEKGMRYAMPNARIMIHQPQTGVEGDAEDVERQINEGVYSRNKIDAMYAAFTGQPLEIVQLYTERDYFFSPAEDRLTWRTIYGLYDEGGVYRLDQSSVAVAYQIGFASESILQWYRHLGHPFLDWLRHIIPPLSSATQLQCDACQLGKHHVLPFKPQQGQRYHLCSS